MFPRVVSRSAGDARASPEAPRLPGRRARAVRHLRGAFTVEGNAPLCHRRAVRSLIPAAAAAAANVFPDIRFSCNRRTCTSVTNPSSMRKTGSLTRSSHHPRTGRSRPRRPAKIIGVDQARHVVERRDVDAGHSCGKLLAVAPVNYLQPKLIRARGARRQQRLLGAAAGASARSPPCAGSTCRHGALAPWTRVATTGNQIG